MESSSDNDEKKEKRYGIQKNVSAMTKYYKNPKNQKKLRERIAKYESSMQEMEQKLKELRKYVFPDVSV